MNFEETVALAKLFSVSLGFDKPNILSDIDLDILKDLFKRMVDNNYNLNEWQRSYFKYMSDILNEIIKGRKNF